jgi:hypothetical protein
VIGEFGLGDLVPRLRAPLLVFGAGRDMVVPAEESVALASAAGDLATLVWYPDGGHGLYNELEDWVALTGEWLNGLVGRGTAAIPMEPAAVDRSISDDEEILAGSNRSAPDVTPVPAPIGESTRVDPAESRPAGTVATRMDDPEPEETDEADEDDIWGQ